MHGLVLPSESTQQLLRGAHQRLLKQIEVFSNSLLANLFEFACFRVRTQVLVSIARILMPKALLN